MGIGLNRDEAMYVASHLRRLTNWDERTSVRLQIRGNALGVYSPPPMGVLALVVVPIQSTDVPELDRVVSAGRLRDLIGDVSKIGADDLFAVPIPDEVTGPPSLAMLPPREGWNPPVHAMAGDLVADIDASIKALNQRTTGTVEPFTRQIAEDVWGTQGWAALPHRVLHAARQLGFLGHPGARIQASVNGTWKRLISPAGQVFVHVESSAPLLRLVR